MGSRTVTSPADEPIEIFDDADWMELTGCNEIGLRVWNLGCKRFVIRELWERGSVSNQAGRATGELYAHMIENFPAAAETTTQATALTMMMKDSNNAPAFERDINGKRCFSIALVALPDQWYQKMQMDIAHDEFVKSREVPAAEDVVANAIAESTDSNGGVLVDELVDPSTDDFDDSLLVTETVDETEVAPVLEIDMASQVAMALLTTCVEIITAGSGAQTDARVRQLTNDIADISHKLSQRLDENGRMRRQLSEAGDTIRALTSERDGLRVRLRQTESNLRAALNGDALHAVNGVIMKKVDEIMRMAPTAKGEG